MRHLANLFLPGNVLVYTGDNEDKGVVVMVVDVEHDRFHGIVLCAKGRHAAGWLRHDWNMRAPWRLQTMAARCVCAVHSLASLDCPIHGLNMVSGAQDWEDPRAEKLLSGVPWGWK